MKYLFKHFINNLSNDNLDLLISEIIEEYYFSEYYQNLKKKYEKIYLTIMIINVLL